MHWGIDVYSGEQVMNLTYQRTVDSVRDFAVTEGKDLRWVYAHLRGLPAFGCLLAYSVPLA